MNSQYDHNLLLGYVEGELSAKDAARVEQWIERDPRLGRLLADMAADRDRLQQLPTPDPPAWLLDDVDRVLERSMLLETDTREVHATTMRQRYMLRQWLTIGAVAAMVLIAAWVVIDSLVGIDTSQEALGPVASREDGRPAPADNEMTRRGGDETDVPEAAPPEAAAPEVAAPAMEPREVEPPDALATRTPSDAAGAEAEEAAAPAVVVADPAVDATDGEGPAVDVPPAALANRTGSVEGEDDLAMTPAEIAMAEVMTSEEDAPIPAAPEADALAATPPDAEPQIAPLELQVFSTDPQQGMTALAAATSRFEGVEVHEVVNETVDAGPTTGADVADFLSQLARARRQRSWSMESESPVGGEAPDWMQTTEPDGTGRGSVAFAEARRPASRQFMVVLDRDRVDEVVAAIRETGEFEKVEARALQDPAAEEPSSPTSVAERSAAPIWPSMDVDYEAILRRALPAERSTVAEPEAPAPSNRVMLSVTVRPAAPAANDGEKPTTAPGATGRSADSPSE